MWKRLSLLAGVGFGVGVLMALTRKTSHSEYARDKQLLDEGFSEELIDKINKLSDEIENFIEPLHLKIAGELHPGAHDSENVVTFVVFEPLASNFCCIETNYAEIAHKQLTYFEINISSAGPVWIDTPTLSKPYCDYDEYPDRLYADVLIRRPKFDPLLFTHAKTKLIQRIADARHYIREKSNAQ